MKSIRNFFIGLVSGRFFFPTILTLLWLVIFFTNYIPGTILSGWDTLHPEFNFPLNFERLLFGSWREEQGLGAVAAHAHIADLPRVVFLWISSVILPMEFLRFFFISLCLLIGVLGIYYFIKNTFFDHLKKFQSEVFSFLGALFYLLNLGTVQHFYVPFEMFTVQFALLPWIFLAVCQYLKKPTKKGLILIGLVNVLGAPMAYASLLWYVYFGSLILFLSFFFFKQRAAVLSIIFTTLFVNLFWILPNLYFLLSGNAALVPDAKINKLFSEEAYLQNATFGTVADVLILKNFLFNWSVYVGFDRFDYLLTFWRNHISQPFVLAIGYGGFFIALFGIVGSIVQKKKYAFSLLLPLLVALFFMMGSTFPLSVITDFLRESNSLFKEALRFPFTKFSIIAMFGLSVFFALGNYYSFNAISKVGLFKLRFSAFVLSLQAIVIAVLLVIYCLPMFQGQLISPLMQVKIPPEYYQMFEYLNKSEEGRVAVFPVHSFWGWIYYDWGFQGAQFITFGIKQPVLDRDWDRWNPKNEEYYRQLSYASYSDDEKLFENVLKKYQIRYLILDQNIIAAGSEVDKRSLNLEQTKLLIQRIDKLEQVETFKDILIYKYDGDFSDVRIGKNLPVEYKASFSEDVDYNYGEKGTYIVEKTDGQNLVSDNLGFLRNDTISVGQGFTRIKLAESVQPVSALLAKESLITTNVYASKNDDTLKVNLIPIYVNQQTSSGVELAFNDFSGESAVINFDNFQTLSLSNIGSETSYQGTVTINTKQFNNIALYEQPKDSAIPITDLSVQQPQIVTDAEQGLVPDFPINLCTKPGENQVFGSSDIQNGQLTITAQNSKACVWVPMDKVVGDSQIKEYKTLTAFNFTVNSNSRSLGRFCLFDMGRQRCVLEQKYVLSGNQNTIYFVVDPSLLSHTQLVLYLDGTEKDKLEQITYDNLSLNYLVPKQIISLSPEELTFKLSESPFLKKELVISNVDQKQFSVDLLEPGHNDNDCSSVQATIAERVVNNGIVTYKSEQGSSCDFYTLPNLSHASGYIVEVETKNNSGLPLRVCIANPYSKRCDIYTTLPNNKTFTKDYILVPPIFDGGVGYDIHFDNYAVGSFKSENDVRSMRLIPIPYHYLRSGAVLADQKSELYDISSNQIFPGLYSIYIENMDNGTIILNEAFDSGWISTAPSSSHVLINSWQNGWNINQPIKNQTVYIFYWPDFLEVGSLILLFIISIPVGFKLLKRSGNI